MDKNMTKKNKPKKRLATRNYLRAGALAALVAVGVGAMAGMALLNAGAKPRRDMKWYVHGGDVQVAAPPVGEGYGEDGVAASSTARRGADILAGSRRLEPEGPAVADIATESPTETPTEAPTETPTEAPDEVETPTGAVTLTITAAGDCTFGGEVGSKGRRRFVDLVEANGNDYFFQNVRTMFEADDLTIVNLEGPLTSSTKPGKRGGFVFKGDPSYVGILSGSSVELCNLANNHTMDYGKAGLKETAKLLEENGIGYCGFSTVFDRTIKGVRVRALGFEWWGSDKDDIAKAVYEARKDCDLLIVNMHWGWEGHREQDARQVSIGHAIIDAGADLVIGTHPHVYEGIEKYKGKYIVYSLGNFCFAGNANPHDKRCLVFQQTFNFNPGMGIARANIMDAGINIIPCAISSEQERNNFQPIILPAEEGSELLKAVAGRSDDFSLSDTRWMKDNYLETYGLLKTATTEEGEPETADVPAEEIPAEATEESEEAASGDGAATI